MDIKPKNKGGRPPKYKTAEELQGEIRKYFDGGYDFKKVVTKEGDVIEVPVITITGLVLFLGFCDRAAFYDYEKKKEFRHTIKRARTFIEAEYEKILQLTGNTGAIFALKNFGWTDRQEIEVTERKYFHVEFKDMNPEQLKEEARNVQNRIAGLVGLCGEN